MAKVERFDGDAECGGRLAGLNMDEAAIARIFGPPLRPGDDNFNDDDGKVDAVWRFTCPSGRAAIWSYYRAGTARGDWSVWYSSKAAYAELLTALAEG